MFPRRDLQPGAGRLCGGERHHGVPQEGVALSGLSWHRGRILCVPQLRLYTDRSCGAERGSAGDGRRTYSGDPATVGRRECIADICKKRKLGGWDLDAASGYKRGSRTGQEETGGTASIDHAALYRSGGFKISGTGESSGGGNSLSGEKPGPSQPDGRKAGEPERGGRDAVPGGIPAGSSLYSGADPGDTGASGPLPAPSGDQKLRGTGEISVTGGNLTASGGAGGLCRLCRDWLAPAGGPGVSDRGRICGKTQRPRGTDGGRGRAEQGKGTRNRKEAGNRKNAGRFCGHLAPGILHRPLCPVHAPSAGAGTGGEKTAGGPYRGDSGTGGDLRIH